MLLHRKQQGQQHPRQHPLPTIHRQHRRLTMGQQPREAQDGDVGQLQRETLGLRSQPSASQLLPPLHLLQARVSPVNRLLRNRVNRRLHDLKAAQEELVDEAARGPHPRVATELS